MAVKKTKGTKSRVALRNPAAAPRDASNSITYLLNDYPRTLFPLSTTRVIAEKWGSTPIRKNTHF
jgi:hypothetical protein